jgi:molybdopterin converting factor small subunit
MPQVKLNLYATLRQYSGGAPSVDVDIEPGTTIEQLLSRVDIPPEKTRILFVNSRHARLSDTLQGGETVGAFPAVGGG